MAVQDIDVRDRDDEDVLGQIEDDDGYDPADDFDLDDDEAPDNAGPTVADYSVHLGHPVGMLYVLVRGDRLPELEAPARFTVRRVDRPRVISAITGLTTPEVERRIRDGHVPYVAFVRDEPVAVGWSAWRLAAIGELGLTLRLPRRDHYLWDFVTVPEWRNRGIYRKMLQEIVTSERDQTRRFWVGHDIDNEPSGRGIVSAGFTPVGEVWSNDGDLVFAAHDNHRFASEAAAMLGIPLAASN